MDLRSTLERLDSDEGLVCGHCGTRASVLVGDGLQPYCDGCHERYAYRVWGATRRPDVDPIDPVTVRRRRLALRRHP